MRRWPLWPLALVLLVLPLMGRLPVHRDLADFFLPMREHTAARLATGELPWLNPANGCGEPWFANPETGVLYPPHWLYLVTPCEWGITLELLLHLGLLAAGAGLLARRLGGGVGGQRIAEAAALCAGPVLTLVGVVNNLDALAWLPWMALAAGARSRTVPLTALAVAAGWLAGEPQVWALGLALAVAFAPRRRPALLGAALGVGLVAVQAVPFLALVLEGNRGPAAAAGTLTGAVSLAGWLSTVVVGAPVAPPLQTPWAESLFLGPPLLTLAFLGARRRAMLLLAVGVLAALATLPAMGGGGLYLLLTRGLVWYPSRFAVVALAILLPLAGCGWRRWLEGEGRIVAVTLGVVAVGFAGLAPTPVAWAATVIPAGVLVVAALLPSRRWLRGAAVGLGLAGCVAAGLPFLASRPVTEVRAEARTPWPAEVTTGRLYSPPPPPLWLPRLSASLAARAAWPVGYLNLEQGLAVARTWAPVTSARLDRQLAEAARGNGPSWWLDALAARWLVTPSPLDWPGVEPVAHRRGLWLHRNRNAWDVAALVEQAPSATGEGSLRPGALALRQTSSSVTVATLAKEPAWIRLSLAPAAGWRWWLDERPVRPRRGPGIVQAVPIGAGRHTLRGRYRPPALAPAAAVSLLALIGVLGALLCPRRARLRREL